jgi:hypothetical protein
MRALVVRPVAAIGAAVPYPVTPMSAARGTNVFG